MNLNIVRTRIAPTTRRIIALLQVDARRPRAEREEEG